MSQTKAQLIDNLVQPITGALGSASAPTFSFTADPNTGVYSPGADQLALATGGVERFTIDANGKVTVDTNTLCVDALSNRVGVGTTNPSFSLHVVGGDISLDTLDGRMLGFGLSSTFTASITTASYGLTRGAAGTNTVGLSGFAGLTFYTNSTERARIDSSGRLLVGNSTARVGEPQGGSVVGYTLSSTFEGTSTVPGSVTAIQNSAAAAYDGPYFYLARTRGTVVGSSTIVVSGDNLGTIAFAGADGTDIRTKAAEIYAQVDGTPGANDMPGRLVFSTTADGASAPTERLRIDSSGRLLAGQTSVLSSITTQRLELTGDISVNTQTTGTGTEASLYLNHLLSTSTATRTGAKITSVSTGTYTAGTAATYDADLTFSTSLDGAVNERARIDSSGRLLVGTPTSDGNNATLQVRNDAAASTHVQVLRSSDTAAAAPIISAARSRGTAASPTEVTTDDLLGTFVFSGYDGAAWASGATIQAYADGTWTDGGDTTDNPSRIAFSTAGDGGSTPIERLRITSDGTLRLYNSPGIDFSQIQTNAAGMTSETLDSYEEGTFTPTIIGATTAGVGTYTTQTARYTKIGRMVYIQLRLVWSAHTGVGTMRVTGLPFNVVNSTGMASVSCRNNNFTLPASTTMQMYFLTNSSDIIVESVPVGGGLAAGLTLDTAADIIIGGCYEAA
jgi:hypothetical protein